VSQVEDNIIEAVLRYAASKGGRRTQWYVGIAKDPKKALFKVHKVPKNKTPWMYKFAFDINEAIRIEDRLLREGFDGDKFPSDRKANGIYVYRKTGETRE